MDKRREYKKEVATLRRAFIFEHQQRLEQAAKTQRVERAKIEKAKQERLAIKRDRRMEREKQHEIKHQALQELKKKQFEEKQAVRDRDAADLHERQHALLAALQHRAKDWVYPENMDEKLKAENFEYALDQARRRNWINMPFSGKQDARTWLQRLQAMKPVFPTDG